MDWAADLEEKNKQGDKNSSVFVPVSYNEATKNFQAYHGGGFPSTGMSTGSKYSGGLSTSVSSLNLNHYALRQNTRKALFDSPQAASIIERLTDSIVDVGLKVEFTPNWRQTGQTEEQAAEWAADHEERFDMWMKSKQFHKAEVMTGYQFQRLYEYFQQRDNDNFVRFHYSSKRDLISPLQLSFIDPNQIRNDEFTSSFGPMVQDDGIKRNADGKEVGYKIWLIDKQGHYKAIDIPATGARSKRTMMIHGFEQKFASQGRGFSRIAYALTEFEKLTDFSLSKIVQAINQSNISMWVKPSADKPASNPLEGMKNSGPIQPITDSGGTPGNDPSGLVDFCPMPEATMDVPGSTGIFSLQDGEGLEFPENRVQGESYETFVNAFTSYLSASTGTPIEVVLMKFNQNYSASRATLVLFWRTCKIWREEMDADLMTPIINSWLAEEIAAGRTIAPGWSDPRLKAAWMSHNLIGAPMPNIDPAREAKAHKELLDISATNLDRVSRETNGSRAKDNIAKNTKLFKEIPIGPWNQKAAGSTEEKNNPKKEEEDE